MLSTTIILIVLVLAVHFVFTATVTTTAHSLKAHKSSIQPKAQKQAQNVNITVDELEEAVLRQLRPKTPYSQQKLLTQYAHNRPSAVEVFKSQRTLLNAAVQGQVDILSKPALLDLAIYSITIDFRILHDAGLLIPGFEACQLGDEIVSPAPHEEEPFPTPTRHGRARASPGLRIEIAPIQPSAEVVEAFKQVKWSCMNDPDLAKHIAVLQRRVDGGKPERYEFHDIPEGDDYFAYQLSMDAWQWNEWHLEYERDQQEALERLRSNPAVNEEASRFRRAVEKYRALDPEEFERHFPGSLQPYEDGVEETTIEFGDESVSSRTATTHTSAQESESSRSEYSDSSLSASSGYSSQSYGDIQVDGVVNDDAAIYAVISRKKWSDLSQPAICDSSSPADSGYSSNNDLEEVDIYADGVANNDAIVHAVISRSKWPGITHPNARAPAESVYSVCNYLNQVDINADAVANDDAVIYAVITRQKWINRPGSNDYLAHKDCTPIMETISKKIAEIAQAPGYSGWSASADYDALQKLGPLAYDQRLYGTIT